MNLSTNFPAAGKILYNISHDPLPCKSLIFFLKRLEDGIELLYKIFPAAGLDSNL
jgi:hypothetical protein